MNTPLAQVFRYNKWANERILDACRSLRDDQLDEVVFTGPGRSIRETLFHVVTGQSDFRARLNGQAQDPTKLGLPGPNLDAWEYSAAAGMGAEQA